MCTTENKPYDTRQKHTKKLLQVLQCIYICVKFGQSTNTQVCYTQGVQVVNSDILQGTAILHFFMHISWSFQINCPTLHSVDAHHDDIISEVQKGRLTGKN